MANRFYRYFIAALFALLSLASTAVEYPSAQNPPQLVNDFASLLSPAQRESLERNLVAFSDTTTVEIAIVTLNSLDGADISMYATELAHRWGVGDKNNDSGVLILVKPKSATEKGEVFIAVGYGLEGAIPDAIASEIVRNVMIPSFSQGDMYGGISGAASILMKLSSGEYSAEQLMQQSSNDSLITFLVVMFIIVVSLNSMYRKRNSGSQTYTHGTTTNHVPPIFFGIPMSGGYRSGSSGGFGGSGFGGGGFGGFGGGGFGGGGAGGSW